MILKIWLHLRARWAPKRGEGCLWEESDGNTNREWERSRQSKQDKRGVGGRLRACQSWVDKKQNLGVETEHQQRSPLEAADRREKNCRRERERDRTSKLMAARIYSFLPVLSVCASGSITATTSQSLLLAQHQHGFPPCLLSLSLSLSVSDSHFHPPVASSLFLSLSLCGSVGAVVLCVFHVCLCERVCLSASVYVEVGPCVWFANGAASFQLLLLLLPPRRSTHTHTQTHSHRRQHHHFALLHKVCRRQATTS